jgi:flavocytochrome c
MKLTGGNTRISDGALAAPGNPIQRREGVEDSADLFYEDLMRAGLGLNHPPLARMVAERAEETIDWTIKFLGVQYLDRLDRFGGHSAARCVTSKSHRGVDLIKAQEAKLKQLGGTIRTQSLFTELIIDKDGSVLGAKIRSGYRFGHPDSGTITAIRARQAVILATGGFGRDVSFRSLQNPALNASIGSTNHRGATAEGLIAALKVNAAPIHLSWVQLGPWGCADERGYGRASSFASYSVYTAGILVDPASGRRIVNEWADRRQRSDAILKTSHECIGIVDAKGAQVASDSLATSLARGHVKAFDTLAELAQSYGMPVQALVDTVDDYNQGIQQKKKDAFGKALAKAQPMNQPPFYAIRLWPKVHYTPGGLGINTDAQVIDLNGRPIPRLFAAGEVCGGVHGASRLGSCALTDCLVFGRIAGQQAAKVAPHKDR